MRLGGTLARGGVPSATLATVRPLAAGSARRDFFLAPQAASSTPPHRLGSPVEGAASRRSRGAVRLSAAVQVHRAGSARRIFSPGGDPPPPVLPTPSRSAPAAPRIPPHRPGSPGRKG